MSKLDNIIHYIKNKKPQFTPKICLILGSGLGALADEIKDATKIPYGNIPDFPQSTVAGHKGQMVLGTLSDMPVVCMQGRIHGYEGADSEDFNLFIRTLKLLGCEILLITNAAGSLNAEIGPGEISLITDHINVGHRVPLMGPNDEKFGQRFFAMTNAYDEKLRERFKLVAQKINIKLHEGVYIGVTGPCFETPAEIRAYKLWGGDLTGMSTVPEVISARHCGLRVAAVSAVTNLAAGMSKTEITHEDTLHYGQLTAEKMSTLIKEVIGSLKNDPC